MGVSVGEPRDGCCAILQLVVRLGKESDGLEGGQQCHSHCWTLSPSLESDQ